MPSDSETPSGIWESYYNAIASANAVLERLDQMKILSVEFLVGIEQTKIGSGQFHRSAAYAQGMESRLREL